MNKNSLFLSNLIAIISIRAVEIAFGWNYIFGPNLDFSFLGIIKNSLTIFFFLTISYCLAYNAVKSFTKTVLRTTFSVFIINITAVSIFIRDNGDVREVLGHLTDMFSSQSNWIVKMLVISLHTFITSFIYVLLAKVIGDFIFKIAFKDRK